MSSSYTGDKSSRKGNDVCGVRRPLSGAFIPPAASEIILIFPASLKRRLQYRKDEQLACSANGRARRGAPATCSSLIHTAWKDFQAGVASQVGQRLGLQFHPEHCRAGRRGQLEEGAPDREPETQGRQAARKDATVGIPRAA